MIYILLSLCPILQLTVRFAKVIMLNVKILTLIKWYIWTEFIIGECITYPELLELLISENKYYCIHFIYMLNLEMSC